MDNLDKKNREELFLRTLSELKEKYPNKKELIKMLNEAEKQFRNLGERDGGPYNRYANRKANNIQAKRENLEKEIENERFNRTISINGIIATAAIAALIVSAYFSHVNYTDTHDLIQKQIDSIAPQKPRLQVFPYNKDSLIISGCINESVRENEIVNVLKCEPRFIFYNLGRMPTGHVLFQLESPGFPGPGWKRTTIINVGNIAGEGVVEVTLPIIVGVDKNVSGRIIREYRDFKEGVFDANAIITCPYCEGRDSENQIILKIKVCIRIESDFETCQEFKESKDNQIIQLEYN